MAKLKAAAYIFWKSLSSPKYYSDILKTKFSFSMKYFAVLALIASTITFPGLIKPILTDLRVGMDAIEKNLISAYPEDLVLTIKGGELSINQPEPYIFEMPEDMKIEKDMTIGEEGGEKETLTNLLVIDTQGTLDDLEKHDTLILVNKTNILVRNSNKIEVYTLTDFPDGEFDAETMRNLVEETKPFFNALPYIVIAFALLGTIIYYFGFRLAYLVVVALVLMAIGTLRGMRLPFSKFYQLGIHALTLPLLIEVLAGVFEFAINYPFWFLALNVLIGILGITHIDKTDIDSRM